MDDSKVADPNAQSSASLRVRIVAYLAILSGYFFYCYNFLLPGYTKSR